MLDLTPRPIKSEMKSRPMKPEGEKPSRWSFMKILREHSDLKQFYPEINPYAEVYPFRENTYAILVEGNGFADTWNYLIVGPEKALLIDTNYGVGNLKALCEHLSGGKEVLCADTHYHIDHIGGNLWWDRVYIHKYDVEKLKEQITPDFIKNATLDENGQPKYTWYDVNDLPPFHEYDIVGFEDGYKFDLGKGYTVEVVHLPGHTAGQCGFLDNQTGCFFIGDVTSAFGPTANPEYGYYCTVNSLRDALVRFQPRFSEVSGVFPGHGTIDLHAVTLQYILDICNSIIAHPDWYEAKKDFFGTPVYAKNIFQMGSDMKYTDDAVIKE
ncbi:MAG: MBL fold metallo-hydrolase [Erysipelotrichaceae bacterium]|nr:MBL fold metallo-hydrolase [Erysipelotrichaceae bacterium]